MTMQNEMRDRLMELVSDAEIEWQRSIKGFAEVCADYLIENGVVVLPIKVGDTIYYPYEYGNKVLEKTVKKIVIENDDKWLDVGVSYLPFENIGKTVFLTKEQAEQKLKEGGEE